jgi:hypothetical protein
VTGPAHGTLSGTAPNLTYTPSTNYSGTDSFTFQANDGTTNSPTATVSISVTAATPATVSIRANANGQIILTIAGVAGQTYDIQSASDVNNTWVGIGSVTVPASGSLDYTDTSASNLSSRFYRVQDHKP